MLHHRDTEDAENANTLFDRAARVDFAIWISYVFSVPLW